MKNYEAYVYKITVKIIGKIYIGYHVGHEQDPYVHSSTDEQMKIDMKEHNFNYEIIDRGTEQNMANLEHKLLTEVDAKNNPAYYNKSNGGGMYLKTGGKKIVDSLWDRIQNGEFLTTYTYDYLKKCKKVQVREVLEDKSHSKLLGDQILAKEGNMEDWNPLTLLLEYADNEEDALGNGTHTLGGCAIVSKTYSISDITVHAIPKSEWNKLSPNQLKTLLNRMNPRDKKPSKAVSDTTAVQWIIERKTDEGIEMTSDVNYQELIDHWGFTKRQATEAMKKAKVELETQIQLPVGHIQCSWDIENSDDKRELDKHIADRIKDDQHAASYSSGIFGWASLMERLLPKYKHKKWWTIYIYHKNIKNKLQWESEAADGYGNRVNNSLKSLGKEYGITFDVKVLDFSKINEEL